MKIEQDRQLLLFLRGMREGVRYIPTEDFWESYQRVRVESGWGRISLPRQDLYLIRQGTRILHREVVVLADLASPSVDLALAFALAARPFTLALTPEDQLQPPKDTNKEEFCFSNLRDLPGQEIFGTPGGFYREGPVQQFYGEICCSAISGDRVNLALRGLTEDQAAEILSILGEPK